MGTVPVKSMWTAQAPALGWSREQRLPLGEVTSPLSLRGPFQRGFNDTSGRGLKERMLALIVNEGSCLVPGIGLCYMH